MNINKKILFILIIILLFIGFAYKWEYNKEIRRYLSKLNEVSTLKYATENTKEYIHDSPKEENGKFFESTEVDTNTVENDDNKEPQASGYQNEKINEKEEVKEKYDVWKQKPTLYDDFEYGLGSDWNREMANDEYSGQITSKFAFDRMYSYRIELRNTDVSVNGGKRSELSTVRAEKPLEEHVYIVSVLLPDGEDEDYLLDPYGSEIIIQWHNTPDPGEEWTYPPLALHTENGRYTLERNWDTSPMSTNEKIDLNGTRHFYDLGSYLEDKGRWVTWTFHIKWGWLKSQNPILEVYKDKKKILDLNGLPNTMNDQVGVHMKLGMYKTDWQEDIEQNKSDLEKRVIYFDGVSIR
ncbi:polysaccharide lyase [Dehalobacter sp. TBBPA1]|uniref:polysaccharide lyase n=1 Tax=Dehalobacter sp. TBBPA1 TaxID=3235037 RepID=UPI0034A4AF13